MNTIRKIIYPRRLVSFLPGVLIAVLAAVSARAQNTVVGDWTFTNSANPGWSLERTTTLTPAGIQIGTPGAGGGIIRHGAPKGLSFINSGVEMIFIGTATASNGDGVQYLSLDNSGFRCCFGLGAPTGPGNSVNDGAAWLNQNYNRTGGENLTRTTVTGSDIRLKGRHSMALVRFDDLTLHAYVDGIEIGSRKTDDTGRIQISSIGVGDNNFNGVTYFPPGTVVERLRAFTFPSGGFEQNQLLLGRTNQPATPAGLKVSPGNGSVSLNWNTAPFASGYNVKRSLTHGGPYAVIGTTKSRAYSDASLVNGTTYYYAVSATNSAGESANSAAASATPSAPPIPAAPAGVAITGNNSQVSLKWNASTAAIGYKVMRSLAQGGPYAVIGSTAETAYTDTHVANNTTYYYMITAGNRTGESAHSAQVSSRVLFPTWKYTASLFIITTPDGANLAAAASEANFPVLVRLNADFFDFSQARSDGGDIRFATTDGAFLAHEIEQWNPSGGTAAIWLRIPLIQGNTKQEIKMRWGSNDALNTSSGSAVFNADNGFVSVLHLDDALTDSAGSTVPVNVGTTAASGVVGKGRHFMAGQGINCGIDLQNFPIDSNPHSTEVWFRDNATRNTLLGWGLSIPQGMVAMQVASPPRLSMNCWGGGNVTGASTIELSQWYHVAHTYKIGEARLYVNGVLDNSSTAGSMSIPAPAQMFIGGFGNRYNFAGDLDEVRISNVTRSADWIKLEYENQKPTQTLVGILAKPGDAFAVSPDRVVVDEGKSLTVSAQAGGAQKVYWTLKKDGVESIIAVDRFSYTLDAGRVTGDQSFTLQFKAVFANGIKTKDIPVTIHDSIPDPVFTLKTPTQWNGRDTIEVVPEISNIAAMKDKGAGELHYTWAVSGGAVIKEIVPGKLILKRSQYSGPLTVNVAIDNGGSASAGTASIMVTEPHEDVWVQRIAEKDEKPEAGQFYPRDDKNEGTLFYNGTLSSAADSVFLKLYADDKLIKTETMKPTAENSYAFTVKIQAGLIKYKVEFGTKTAGTETLLQTVNNLVCGDAYLIDGQSNALALDTNEQSPNVTSEWIRSYGGPTGQGQGGKRPNLWSSPAWRPSPGSSDYLGWWGMDLAKKLLESNKMPICIIQAAVGGTRIDEHKRNETNPVDLATIYGRMLWRVQQARLTHGIRAVLWHQGEADQGSDGPDGGYGWETYQNYFLNMSAAWKQDMPNIRHYYVFQIWPNGCSQGNGHGDMLREKQRSLSRLYSNLDVMSTLGIKPPGGCHYPLTGWSEFARLMQPLIERDFHGRKVPEPITAPDLKQAYYASAAKDAIILEFDQAVIWLDSLAGQFYLDDAKEKVAKGSVNGNVITLQLKAPATAGKITYLKELTWNENNLVYGKNGIAALTFCDVPILPEKPSSK